MIELKCDNCLSMLFRGVEGKCICGNVIKLEPEVRSTKEAKR